MKNLKEIIQEKLYHQQVDEKLVFNKHTKAKNHNYYNTCDELVRHVNDLYYIKLSDKVQNDIIESIKDNLKNKLDINKYIFVRIRKIFKDQFSMDLITSSGEAYLSHKEFYQDRAIYFNNDISVFYESDLLDRQIGITKFLIFVNYKNSCIHHYCLIDKNDINKYNLNENLHQLDEKLIFNKHTKAKQKVYNYQPKTYKELLELVNKLIEERGNEADLNDIDTSNITDMTNLFYKSSFNGDISNWDVGNVKIMYGVFYNSHFNGDISKWNVSNVENMAFMFFNSEFTGENADISNWDVSNVEDMSHMFADSNFNGDISDWDVSNVKDMCSMFYKSLFNGDISKWNVSKVEDMGSMFSHSKFTGENGDISNWDVSNVKDMLYMFAGSTFNGDISKWNVSNVKDMQFMFYRSPLEKNPPKWYKE